MAISVLVCSGSDVISWRAVPCIINGSGGEGVRAIDIVTDVVFWAQEESEVTGNTFCTCNDLSGADQVSWEDGGSLITVGYIGFS